MAGLHGVDGGESATDIAPRSMMVWILVAALGVTCTACAPDARSNGGTEPPASQSESIDAIDSDLEAGHDPVGFASVRVAAAPFLATVPLHAGLAAGIFEKHGLRVELVPLRRNMDALPSLISGGLDVGIGQPTIGVLRAIGNGARLRLVADSGHAAPGCANVAYLTRREVSDSGRLDEAGGFLQLTVETDLALPQAYWLDLAVRPLGLTLDDLSPVNLPLPTVIEGLEVGRIDLASLSEPNLSKAQSRGALVPWRNVADLAPGFQFSAVQFGPELLDERPEVGRRFLHAWLEAAAAVGHSPNDSQIAAMASATGEDPAVLRSACWPKRSHDGRIDPRGLLAYQSWAVRRGLLDRELRPSEMIPSARLLDQPATDQPPTETATDQTPGRVPSNTPEPSTATGSELSGETS